MNGRSGGLFSLLAAGCKLVIKKLASSRTGSFTDRPSSRSPDLGAQEGDIQGDPRLPPR